MLSPILQTLDTHCLTPDAGLKQWVSNIVVSNIVVSNIVVSNIVVQWKLHELCRFGGCPLIILIIVLWEDASLRYKTIPSQANVCAWARLNHRQFGSIL
jgi:hypothetical protein